MKKLLTVLTLLSLPSLAVADTVVDLTKRYLDGLFAAKPHLATFMGDHRFDGKLPDVSDQAVKQRIAALVGQEREAAALAKKKMSDDDQIDAAILRDGIALELLYLREIRDWEWDPRLYDSFPYYDPREIVAGRLSDIVHGDFAPEAERLKYVESQLEALPKFLADMQVALERASRGKGRRTPKVYVEAGIRDNKGRIEFFESEVKAFTKNSPTAEKARVAAIVALQKYQKFLVDDLAKRADGDWRLGAALYRKKFPLALGTDVKPDEVIARAEKSFASTKLELLQVSRELATEMALPKLGKETDAQLTTRVKDELAKNHPKPAELLAAHAQHLDEMRAFIEAHNLLALPPRDTLRVEAMPEFKRGSSAAEYLAPGVLDRRPAWHATYYVDPIDSTWPADRVESYLRGQNNYEVQLVATHEAYPGHHTQYFYSKRNLNPLRAVLWNAAFVEGWAVYGEGQMVANGYGGKDTKRFRFYDLRGRMVVATNILLDIKLQSGQMSDEEAVRFMVEEGFQEKAMAEKKLLRAKLDSTQLAQYFLGLDEILALERDYKKQVGDKWNQRQFNESLIGHGSIGVKFLRRYLLAAVK